MLTSIHQSLSDVHLYYMLHDTSPLKKNLHIILIHLYTYTWTMYMYICTYLKTCHSLSSHIICEKIDIPKSQACFTTGPLLSVNSDGKVCGYRPGRRYFGYFKRFWNLGMAWWGGQCGLGHDVDVIFKGFLRIVNQLQPFNRDLLFCISLSFQIYPISVPNHTGMNQSLMFIQDYW